MDDLFKIKGKKAIITGGCRGIGYVFAKALAKRGVDIAVIGRKTKCDELEKKIVDYGQKFFYYQIDLRNRSKRDGLIDKIVEDLEGVDFLINNAGEQYQCPICDYSLKQWDDDIELMLTAPFDLSKQVYPYMRKQKSGKIIHMASISSFQGARNIIGYSTVKHALIGLTKCMSNEWAKDNIQINAIAPGIIETDMSASTVNDKEKSNILKSRIPSGRFGVPEDLIGTLIFLVSNASNHITGTTIIVDGGWLGR